MAATNQPVLEIRTYRLHPGGRDRFDAVFREIAVPLMLKHGITVVDFGPSLVDEQDEPGEGYYLVRAFSSLNERTELEGSFYGSDEWRNEHRDGVLALMHGQHHTIVIPTSAKDEMAWELRIG